MPRHPAGYDPAGLAADEGRRADPGHRQGTSSLETPAKLNSCQESPFITAYLPMALPDKGIHSKAYPDCPEH